MFATNPEIQIHIETIAPLLRALPIGQIVTYGQIEAALGASINRLALMRARQIVEAETGMRFETVRKVGVKKIDAGATAGIGAAARSRIGRIAKRQSARLCGLGYNDISRDTQTTIDMERSLLGAIAATASAAAIRKIEGSVVAGPAVAARVFAILGE